MSGFFITQHLCVINPNCGLLFELVYYHCHTVLCEYTEIYLSIRTADKQFGYSKVKILAKYHTIIYYRCNTYKIRKRLLFPNPDPSKVAVVSDI